MLSYPIKPDAATRLYAVIGDPVAHSLSPLMHNTAFQRLGVNAVYLAFQVKPDRLGDAIKGLRALGISGLSVTIPHKTAIIAHLDDLDSGARAIGAVNTVVNEDGRLIGYNTDIAGVTQPLKARAIDLNGAAALIVGAGGAARAAAVALLKMGCRRLFVANRRLDRAMGLIDDLSHQFGFEGEVVPFTPDAIGQVVREVALLFNATPLGMHPYEGVSPIPAESLRAGQVVFDAVYRPFKTRLIREAEAMGATTILGYEMLVAQGAEALRLWLHREPPLEEMSRVVREVLEHEGRCPG
jgi:shikimate dehydrogenase